MNHAPNKPGLSRPPVTYTPAWRRRRRWPWGVAAAILLLFAGALWLRHERRLAAIDRANASDAVTRAPDASSPSGATLRRRSRMEIAGAAGGRHRLAPTVGRSARNSAEAQQPALTAPFGVSGGVTTAVPADAQSRATELPVFTALRASRAQPIPPEVVALAQQITNGATNEAMRARALYDWITANIRYDVQEWAHITGGGDHYMNRHDPLSVLARGTTVCSGYSWLFDAMARSVNLDSTFLIGDVRGYRGTPDDALVSPFQHAWNAVRIDGEWQLLDATWGARQTGEAAEDGLARRDYYFDTPPSQMIFDHLPESPEWQLLDEPLPDAAAFNNLPNLKPAFFQHGLRLGNAFSSTVVATAAQGGTLIVTAPEKVGVAATLSSRGDGAAARTLTVVKAGEQRQVVVDPMPPGEYILRLYSKTAQDDHYACGADFALRVE